MPGAAAVREDVSFFTVWDLLREAETILRGRLLLCFDLSTPEAPDKKDESAENRQNRDEFVREDESS